MNDKFNKVVSKILGGISLVLFVLIYIVMFKN